MEKHPISEYLEITMQRIRDMVDVNTIIGNPVTTNDGITVIPVSKVSFGFGTGGSDFTKEVSKDLNFGCGGVVGVNISPVAFIVVKDGDVRLLNVSEPANTTVDRLVDMVPGVIDKVSDMIKKDKCPEEE